MRTPVPSRQLERGKTTAVTEVYWDPAGKDGGRFGKGHVSSQDFRLKGYAILVSRRPCYTVPIHKNLNKHIDLIHVFFFKPYTPTSYMGVSLNGGTPKSSISMGVSSINHPFWGTTIF